MDDREMLERAATAAGYDVRWHEHWACHVHCAPFNTDQPPTPAGQCHAWVPLDDDGDAGKAVRRVIVRAAAMVADSKTPNV